MRLSAFYFFTVIFFVSCAGSDKKDPASNKASSRDSTSFTTIEWLDSANKDFGKIPEGKKLDVAFRFKNTGDKPLIISKVEVSCGCTVAEQPTEPILPGSEGVIRATFNSEHHTGVNNKTLYVSANTKKTQMHQLHFVVIVENKKW